MNKDWTSFMDRRVKERLVGATILVVLLVLIVPELLSGPKRMAPPTAAGPAEAVRNVTVDLATSKATAGAETAASAADEPPPGTSAPTITTLQAQQPASPPLENNAAPPKLTPGAAKTAPPHDAPAPDAAHHNWAVQLGSFASRVNAEKLERQLKAQSMPAYISSSGSGRTLRYRVRVGPLADRAAADRTTARLRNEGHSANAIAL